MIGCVRNLEKDLFRVKKSIRFRPWCYYVHLCTLEKQPRRKQNGRFVRWVTGLRTNSLRYLSNFVSSHCNSTVYSRVSIVFTFYYSGLLPVWGHASILSLLDKTFKLTVRFLLVQNTEKASIKTFFLLANLL